MHRRYLNIRKQQTQTFACLNVENLRSAVATNYSSDLFVISLWRIWHTSLANGSENEKKSINKIFSSSGRYNLFIRSWVQLTAYCTIARGSASRCHRPQTELEVLAKWVIFAKTTLPFMPCHRHHQTRPLPLFPDDVINGAPRA